jgi:hypothetical protein
LLTIIRVRGQNDRDTKESIIDKTWRHSREGGNPGEKTGFPRIKYGAGLVKPGMTKQGECLYNYGLISNVTL